MAKTTGNRLNNRYVRGLITEATALTFPENASYDELNMELLRNGSRRRRRGINREAGASFANEPDLSDLGVTQDQFINQQFTTYKWVSVGGDPDLNLLVVQVGPSIVFFDAGSQPIVDGFRTEKFSLDTYSVATNPGNVKCQFAAGKGKLFVANPLINPFYVTYNSVTDTLSDVSIDLRIRDFEGVDDGLEVTERPSTLSNEHKYNLRNQGWFEDSVIVLKAFQSSDDPITAFFEYTGIHGENYVG